MNIKLNPDNLFYLARVKALQAVKFTANYFVALKKKRPLTVSLYRYISEMTLLDKQIMAIQYPLESGLLEDLLKQREELIRLRTLDELAEFIKFNTMGKKTGDILDQEYNGFLDILNPDKITQFSPSLNLSKNDGTKEKFLSAEEIHFKEEISAILKFSKNLDGSLNAFEEEDKESCNRMEKCNENWKRKNSKKLPSSLDYNNVVNQYCPPGVIEIRGLILTIIKKKG